MELYHIAHILDKTVIMGLYHMAYILILNKIDCVIMGLYHMVCILDKIYCVYCVIIGLYHMAHILDKCDHHNCTLSHNTYFG